MILVIPSLHLRNGECSLFIKSESTTSPLYRRLSNRPAELCALWRRENAKTIHITDFDSNETLRYSNMDSIIFLAGLFDIPFQVLANFRNKEECEYLLDNGIYRICFGEFAYFHPDDTRKLIEKYGSSRIIGFIDSNNEKIQFSQFTKVMPYEEMMQYLIDLGMKRILFKEELWLKSKSSVDIDLLKKLAENYKIKLTLYESIVNSKDLWRLNSISKYGVDSLVVGPALYDNNFPCQKLWRKIEAELES